MFVVAAMLSIAVSDAECAPFPLDLVDFETPTTLLVGELHGTQEGPDAVAELACMATAMKHAVIAGREAYLAGRMPKKKYADPSSPLSGLI